MALLVFHDVRVDACGHPNGDVQPQRQFNLSDGDNGVGGVGGMVRDPTLALDVKFDSHSAFSPSLNGGISDGAGGIEGAVREVDRLLLDDRIGRRREPARREGAASRASREPAFEYHANEMDKREGKVASGVPLCEEDAGGAMSLWSRDAGKGTLLRTRRSPVHAASDRICYHPREGRWHRQRCQRRLPNRMANSSRMEARPAEMISATQTSAPPSYSCAPAAANASPACRCG